VSSRRNVAGVRPRFCLGSVHLRHLLVPKSGIRNSQRRKGSTRFFLTSRAGFHLSRLARTFHRVAVLTAALSLWVFHTQNAMTMN
jgi:hypothetical protein